MSLWNEQIDSFNVNDEIRIENGYVTSFRGEAQLNVGRYGRLIPKQQ
jgi:replication factor A1